MIQDSVKEKKIISPTIVQSSLSSADDTFTSLSTSALLAKNSVPVSHKRVADNYMIIKKIYKFQVINSRLSSREIALLKKYDFSTLEFSTIKQINEELAYLKKWAFSSNEILSEDANEIIAIRAKELKYIVAGRYCAIDDEAYRGYKALERYFEEITKFYR
jgi:hypothetical protein